jgi:hypothetical protein
VDGDPTKERVKKSLAGLSNPCRLPAVRKKFPDIRSGFPAHRAQGNCRKPLLQLHNTERESSRRRQNRKQSLQNTLRAVKRALLHTYAIDQIIR